MNILIVSSGGSTAENALPVWKHPCSHNIQYCTPRDEFKGIPDAIVSMSISLLNETERIVDKYPDIPLFCYNWDCYEWVWKYPNSYNWAGYGRLLNRAVEVWVPSYCTGIRTKEWWGLDNWKVIRSACSLWETNNVRDGGYVLCCLREIPDPWWGKFEEACRDLQIPYKMTQHRASLLDYQRAVANCRFLCAPLYELSTGGLSLLEGYYLGKPCLVSNSIWNGARDYLGDRAVYFEHGNWVDFKAKLLRMFRSPPMVASDHREYVIDHFSYSTMLNHMLGRIHEHRSVPT